MFNAITARSSLLVLLALMPALGSAETPQSFEEHFCGEAMGIYLPNAEGKPAANITLADFQMMSPQDRCVRNLPHDELMRLHAAVKPIAAAAFAKSEASFGVMVRYTLTPDRPATFDMQVRDAPDAETERLTRFHNEAETLRNFHSTTGTVYVVIHYTVHANGAPVPAD